jgi:uncharacterized protein (DUF952 family)
VRRVIYKLLPAAEWAVAVAQGSYPGSAVDRRDGFLHFSAAGQAAETAAIHFSGQTGLVLLTVDPELLGGEKSGRRAADLTGAGGWACARQLSRLLITCLIRV